MSIRDDFFAAQAKASLWDVAVSIKRGNPLPLDANAVYASYGVITNTTVVDGVEKHTYTAGSLLEYAKTNPVAYPGQICAVVDVDATTIYYLDQNLDIQPVGIIPTGDNKTIEVTANGAISLLGAANAANGTLPMIDSETGKLVWKTLEDIGAGDGNDNTTYEFEANEEGNGFVVTPLFNGQPIYEGEGEEKKQIKIEVALDVYTKGEVDNAIKVLADKIGIEATEEDDATGLYGLIAAEVARATGAENALSVRIGAAKTDDADATGVYAYVDGVVEALVNGVDPEKIDSLNELIAWVEAHPAIVEELDGRLDKVEEILEGIGGENKPETVIAAIEAAEGRAAVDAQTKANTAKSEAIADAATKYYAKADVYTKGEADAKIDEKIASVTGGESAADVKLALESYRNAANSEIWGADAEGWTTTTTVDGKTVVTYTPQYGNKSRIDLLEEAVDALEAVGAQANVIESVVGATDNRLSITTSGKTVTIDDANLRTDIAAALKAGTDANAAAHAAQGTANEALGTANNNAGEITTLKGIVNGLKEDGTDGLVKKLAVLETEVHVNVDARLDAVEGILTGSEDDNGLVAIVTGHTDAIKTLNENTIPALQEVVNGKVAQGEFDSLAAKVDTGDYTVRAYVAGAVGKIKVELGTLELETGNAEEGSLGTVNLIKVNGSDVALKGEGPIVISETTLSGPSSAEWNGKPVLSISADAYTKTETNNLIAALAGEGNTSTVKANADAIKTLIGNVEGDNAKSVRTIAAEETAKIVAGADEDYNTLKEIADFIKNDITGAAGLTNTVNAHSNILDGIGEGKTYETVLAAIEGEKYVLPGATVETLGGIKSAADVNGKAAVNKVYVDATTNVAEVKAISTDNLVQGENELILFGGKANGFTA